MIVPLGHVQITEYQIAKVTEALRNNRISRGPFTDRLEQLIAEIHGVKHAIFMCSGTSALLIALEAAKEIKGWSDGAEVIVPATTFIATLAAVRQAGLKPVLCDVRLDDMNIDVEQIESHVTDKTVAILPVHLLGRVCDMERLLPLSDEIEERIGHDVDVIEDCCEAIGVSIPRGFPVGSLGLASAVSTYVCHHISTGIGGLVLTDDERVATIARSLMVHGRNPSYLRLEDDDDLDDAGMKLMMNARYNFIRWGHSFRASEMEAALGVCDLETNGTGREVRREIAYKLLRVFNHVDYEIENQHWLPGSSPLFYPIVCKTPGVRMGLSRHFERAGIETRPVMSLLNQPIVLKMLAEQGQSADDFPVAKQIMERAFLIGCHPAIGDAEIELIRETTESYFKSERKA